MPISGLTEEGLRHHITRSPGVVNLSDAHLSEETDLPILVAFLNANPSVTALCLSFNGLTMKGVETLTALTHIEVLDLSHNDIRDEGIATLQKMGDMELEKLYLMTNGFTDRILELLASPSSFPTLMVLGLDGNVRMSEGAHKKVAEQLSERSPASSGLAFGCG